MILFFYKNHLADATHSSHWFDRSQVLMSLSRQKHNARLKHNAQNSVMLQTQFREEFTSLPVHHQKVTSCFLYQCRPDPCQWQGGKEGRHSDAAVV
jgi:hypothetical protein